MNNRIGTMYRFAMILALAFSSVFPAAAAAASPVPLQYGDEGNIPVPIGKTDYLSIPAAAFTPSSQSYNYENHGRYLIAYGSASKFRAPVYLPNGSVIQRVSVCFKDDSIPNTGMVRLNHLALNSGASTVIAQVNSLTSSDFQLNSSISILSPITNSYAYAYWLELTLPASSGTGNDVWGCGVTIEYARPATEQGIISMPGAAFDHPFQDGYNAGQMQVGGQLTHFEDGGGTHGSYVAQVRLPHGAVVTKMSLYFHDDDAHQINLYLERSHNELLDQLAWAYSLDYLNKVDVTAFSYPTIDIINFTYWAYVELAPANLQLWAVTIEFNMPANVVGYLPISDAAFTPFYDGYDYENHGRYLFHKHSEGGGTNNGIYVAPVNLPQGSTVLGIDFFIYDGSIAQNGSGTLARTKLGSYEVMAYAFTSGHDGYEDANPDPYVVASNSVDNSQYNYFVFYSLPVTSVHSPPISGDVVASRIVILYRMNYYNYLPGLQITDYSSN